MHYSHFKFSAPIALINYLELVTYFFVYAGWSEADHSLAAKTGELENFVFEFMNRCFTLIENSR